MMEVVKELFHRDAAQPAVVGKIKEFTSKEKSDPL